MVALKCSIRGLLLGTMVLASTALGVLAGPQQGAPPIATSERFTIYFFDQEGSAAATEMWQVLQEADAGFQARVEVVRVRQGDPGAQELKQKYGVINTPFTLVVSPSGTITGGHAGVVGLDEIRRGLVSPTVQAIISAAQQRKVIFVVVPGVDPQSSERARAATRKIEAALGRTVAVVEMDPDAAANRTFLANLGVEQFGPEVAVVVLSSAGLVDRLDGEITSTQLFASFQSVLATNSGCGGANEGGLKASCKEK